MRSLRKGHNDAALKRLIWAAGWGLILLALILLALAKARYEACLRLAQLATGSGDPLARADFARMAPRLRQGGVFYGALGLSLVFFRSRLTVPIAAGLRETRTALAWYRRTIAETIQTETRLHLAALAFIGLLGAYLRVAYLGEPPRYDEAFTYLTFARRSIVHVFTYYPAPNNHILYSGLEWLCCRIAGGEPWVWRIPALLAGMALLPLNYGIARRLGGRNAGLYAAGFTAISSAFILYSANARGYMLQAVFFAAMLLLAIGLTKQTADGGSWVLFSAAAVAGFWTVPTMLYAYLIAVAWLLWHSGFRLFRPVLISGAAISVATLALYMPVAIVSGAESLLWNPWVRPLSRAEFWMAARQFPTNLARFLHSGDPLAVPILLGLGVVLSFIPRIRQRDFRPHLFLVTLLVLAAVPALQRVVPFPRALVPELSVYYISAAIGWSAMEEKLAGGYEQLRVAVLLAILGAAAFHLTRSGRMEAYREYPAGKAVAGFLARGLRPCDRLIISVSAGPQLEYELLRAGIDSARYAKDTQESGRVLVAMAHRDGSLPPPGNGPLRPFELTLEGTLLAVRLNTDKYSPPRLIYSNGNGEVFELTAREAAENSGRCMGR